MPTPARLATFPMVNVFILASVIKLYFESYTLYRTTESSLFCLYIQALTITKSHSFLGAFLGTVSGGTNGEGKVTLRSPK